MRFRRWRRVLCLMMTCVMLLCMGSMTVSAEDTSDIDERAEEILSSMTLHEKACQLMVSYQVQLPNVAGRVDVTDTGGNLKKSLEEWPVGGILYDASNMKSHDQLTDLIAKGQEYSKYPMFICIDEEGGRVARLGLTLGYLIGSVVTYDPMLSYENEGPETAYENANMIGQNIASHGFNLDYAPVADVHSNPANPVINNRAYSTDFNTAAILIPAAVKGFQDAGVAATLKHFPGHGDTSSDTHTGAVYVNKTVEEMRSAELKPFQAGIDNNVDSVMIAHLTVNEKGEPCLFSYDIVTKLLREEMGFDGIAFSDGLNMKAITDNYSIPEIVKGALDAGADMFCCMTDTTDMTMGVVKAVTYIEEAVLEGEITESRIDESVRRIIKCKLERGVMT